jgi:hypothetical protein
MSRVIVNQIRHTGASADAITLDSSGNVTFPANVTCSGTATGMGGGKILQVKQVVKTDTFSLAASSTNQRIDITGLTIDITPSSASNKILIDYRVNAHAPNGALRVMIHLMRGSSDIYIGDQDSGQNNQIRCSNHMISGNDGVGGARSTDLNGQFLDSPSTTSATTYKLQLHARTSGNTYYINRGSYSSNDAYVGRQPSHITVMEVSA